MSEFFFTKNPNLKKKSLGGGVGGGWKGLVGEIPTLLYKLWSGQIRTDALTHGRTYTELKL